MRCPKLLDELDFGPVMGQDQQSAMLAKLMELYGDCALRHDALIDYVEKP